MRERACILIQHTEELGVLLVEGEGACQVDDDAGGVQAGVVDVGLGATQVDVGVWLVVGGGGGGAWVVGAGAWSSI